jgi:hypothetical protein
MIPVDHVLYINLEYRADRKKHVLEQASKVGIPEEKLTRINAIHTPKIGMLGCSLSHCKALELAKSHPEWEWTLIVEDDIAFKENPWNEIRLALENATPDVLMIARGASIVHERRHYSSNNLCKVKSACVAAGYIVHRNYIPTLLENIYESIEHFIQPSGNVIDHPHDVYWYSIQERDRWYTFEETPAWALNADSDIR